MVPYIAWTRLRPLEHGWTDLAEEGNPAGCPRVLAT